MIEIKKSRRSGNDKNTSDRLAPKGQSAIWSVICDGKEVARLMGTGAGLWSIVEPIAPYHDIIKKTFEGKTAAIKTAKKIFGDFDSCGSFNNKLQKHQAGSH